MANRIGVLVGITAAVFTTGAAASELPPITPALLNTSALTCVRIGDDGSITGAFLIGTTGDPEIDQHVVDWVRNLHWLPATPGEKLCNTWFPMPVAFGNAKAPEAPDSCSPPTQAPDPSPL